MQIFQTGEQFSLVQPLFFRTVKKHTSWICDLLRTISTAVFPTFATDLIKMCTMTGEGPTVMKSPNGFYVVFFYFRIILPEMMWFSINFKTGKAAFFMNWKIFGTLLFAGIVFIQVTAQNQGNRRSVSYYEETVGNLTNQIFS